MLVNRREGEDFVDGQIVAVWLDVHPFHQHDTIANDIATIISWLKKTVCLSVSYCESLFVMAFRKIK